MGRNEIKVYCTNPYFKAFICTQKSCAQWPTKISLTYPDDEPTILIHDGVEVSGGRSSKAQIAKVYSYQIFVIWIKSTD